MFTEHSVTAYGVCHGSADYGPAELAAQNALVDQNAWWIDLDGTMSFGTADYWLGTDYDSTWQRGRDVSPLLYKVVGPDWYEGHENTCPEPDYRTTDYTIQHCPYWCGLGWCPDDQRCPYLEATVVRCESHDGSHVETADCRHPHELAGV